MVKQQGYIIQLFSRSRKLNNIRKNPDSFIYSLIQNMMSYGIQLSKHNPTSKILECQQTAAAAPFFLSKQQRPRWIYCPVKHSNSDPKRFILFILGALHAECTSDTTLDAPQGSTKMVGKFAFLTSCHTSNLYD